MAKVPFPKDANDFLRRKKIVPTELWSDISGAEHAHAFTASHIMESDMLESMLGILTSAQIEGKPFSTIRKEFKQMMTMTGWYLNPDKINDEEYTNWRIGIIYDTNARTSYSAGRYRQQSRISSLRPYLVYKQLQRPTKRETHEPLHNVCQPFDDPFWDTYYPPNGWRCGCEARSLSKKQAENGILNGSYHRNPSPNFSPDRDVPVEWRHNPGMEMISPDFSKFTNLKNLVTKDGKNALYSVIKQYQNEIKDWKLSKKEWDKVVDLYAPTTGTTQKFQFFAGCLDSSIAKKIDVTDTKMIYSSDKINHSVRDSKAINQKISIDELKKLPSINENPDRIYIDVENHYYLFIKELNEKEVIKSVFSLNKNSSFRFITSGRLSLTSLESNPVNKRLF